MIDHLLKLAPRERMLLALLVFAVLPLALSIGLLLPLHERRLAAIEDEADAQALFEWVAARAEEKLALQSQPGRGPRRRAIGSSGLERSLIEAGLRDDVTELAARAEGAIELRFDDVDFTALADWLSRMEPLWGYRIETFRFEALDVPARVAATLRLLPAE